MWTKEWPTKPGWYWFYGLQFSGLKEDPRHHMVQVFEAGLDSNSHLVYICDGNFMFKSEAGEGVWHETEPPLLPKYIGA